MSDFHFNKRKSFCLPPFRALSPRHPGTILRIQMTVYYYLCQFLQFQLHHNPLPKYVCAPNHSTTMPQFQDEYLSHTHIIYVDLNLLVGVMTFTFSPLHCFYATIIEGGAADRRRHPILVLLKFSFTYTLSILNHVLCQSCCRYLEVLRSNIIGSPHILLQTDEVGNDL